MKWVKLPLCPPRHVARLAFRKTALEEGINHLTPEFAESYFRETIRRVRPELAECTIHAIDFDFMRREWEVLAEHPSLPIVPLGDICERIEMPTANYSTESEPVIMEVQQS